MRRSLLPLGFLLLCTFSAFGAALPPLDLGGVREEHVMIPMRDGVHLSAYIYFPSGDGKWPVIFEQRYAAINGAYSRKGAADIARNGFVVAAVNYRGAQESEGKWVGYRALAWGEHQDGYDICEWLAKQPWSTGKIGTYGGSQAGFAQNFLAVTQPPHLVCQYMTDTGLSLFQEGYRIGGVTRPIRFKAADKLARDPADNEALLREWDTHPDYDDYWRQEDCSLHFPQMNVPCFTLGSWYDFMCQGSVASFIGRQQHGGEQSRGKQQLLIGPWLHGGVKGNKIAEMVFPENAGFPSLQHLTRWFAHYLKGEDNGVEKEPIVRYYVMGAAGEPSAPGNVWREAQDWPPASESVSFYLHGDGLLSKASPGSFESNTQSKLSSGPIYSQSVISDPKTGRTTITEVIAEPILVSSDCSPEDHYASDPLRPMSMPGPGFLGAKDARPFERQSEVRTWTTEPLREPVEWTGEVTAELYVSSTARDTDFIARVSDVYPDGRSMLLMDYPLRARYRNGFDKEALLKPGEVAKLTWHVGQTSLIFNKGHRIRVTVASTGASLYEPNNQTGGPQTIDWMKDAVPAINTIWHDAARPSRIIAPVVKAAK